MDQRVFPAHIRSDGSIQTVEEHCIHTGEYTSLFLSSVDLKQTGQLAGLLHDIGKLTEAFSRYINDSAQGKKTVRGSVNHTFAGVRYILEYLVDDKNPAEEFTGEILAYAVGAHHGQFDCIGEDGGNGFQYRCQKDGIGFEEVLSAIKSYEPILKQKLLLSCNEMGTIIQQIGLLAGKAPKEQKTKTLHFLIGCTARLVQSALIDADRRDTAEYMNQFVFPSYPEDMRALWKEELDYAQKKMDAFDQTTAINRARKNISDQCYRMAETKGSIFRLNVPTGAGKTVSSLRFALAYAYRNNKRRIIFTSPLLSILEQNAEVIRNFIVNQAIVLEHHSDAVHPTVEEGQLNLAELYLQDWDIPIIITTLVQLLNTMFSGDTTCIRRFHALCDAIIVIDEVQTVPDNMVSLFNLMISYLCEICHTTVVLCSATQPTFEYASFPLLIKPINMVPYSESVWRAFQRTSIEYNSNQTKCCLDDLPEYVEKLVGNSRSLLVICNKKSEAETLFKSLQGMKGRYDTYHLSASMCMEHRKTVLKRIRENLKKDDGRQMICVSTQVIEAGVDISFERVIRLLTGMDSVVQASGRCNRNHESEDLGKVYILNCTDEDLTMLNGIMRGKSASMQLLYRYEREPELFHHDLSSDESIITYYRCLYDRYNEHFQEYTVKGKNYTLLSLLSSNQELANLSLGKDQIILHQAFKLAGNLFSVFDKNTTEVIVPYGEEGRSVITDLCSERAEYDSAFVKEILKLARGYTVTLFDYQRKQLEKAGGIIQIPALGIWYLTEEYYDEDTGLTSEQGFRSYLEV